MRQARSFRSSAYDALNRVGVYEGTTVATCTYYGDGLKRKEIVGGVTTTLVWDGAEYLGEY